MSIFVCLVVFSAIRLLDCAPTDLEFLDFTKLELFSLDDEGKPSLIETSKYVRMWYGKYKTSYDCTFNKGVKCSEVRYGGVSVWKHDPDEHGDDYPINVMLKIKAHGIWIVLSEFYYYYMESGGKWELRITRYKPEHDFRLRSLASLKRERESESNNEQDDSLELWKMRKRWSKP